MKNLSQKNKIIIGGCLLLAIIVVGLVIGFAIKKNKVNEPIRNNINLKEMLNGASKLEVTINTDKKVELSNLTSLDADKKVMLWVFSNPIYLGEFSLINNDGKYYLEGIEGILSSKYITFGNHQVLILQDDKAVGYFNISLANGSLLTSEEMNNTDTSSDEETPDKDINQDDSSNKDNNDKPASNTTNKDNNTNDQKEETTTTKEVEVLEDIKFTTEEIKEKNMLKGKRETTEAGEKGQKKITYKVTYDKNNKEIKREKISEVVVKEVKNAKVKVGLSDYNLNDNPTYGIVSGLICEDADASSMGYQECDDTKPHRFYQAIEVGNKLNLICFDDNNVCDDYTELHFELSSYPTISKYQSMYTVNYNGKKYFLDMRSGRDGNELDEATCTKLGLVCNRW